MYFYRRSAPTTRALSIYPSSYEAVSMNRDNSADGNHSSLSDVFAFIETFDNSDSESSLADVASSDGDSGSVSSPDLVHNAESVPSRSIPTTFRSNSTKKAKTRLPGQVPQSTKFQRERRDQVLGLRQQVLELSARLEQLQHTRRRPTTVMEVVQGPLKPKGFVSVWEDLAIVQYQERQRSEQTNQELKTMLARQRKLERSVCKLLGRKDALKVCVHVVVYVGLG